MDKSEELRISFDYAMDRDEVFVLACTCIVQYSGRAESFLPEGDRLIVIKEDKTLLVHQPKGSNAINYMRSGSSHELISAGSKLILKSRNLPMKEYLDITVSRVHFFESSPMVDGKGQQVSGTEKDMSDMIMKKPGLISPYFRPLSREEHTKYGFIDVLGYEDNILTIIECKRVKGDPKAVDQLRRYVEAVKERKGIDNVQGILVCPEVSEKAEKMLAEYGFGYVKIKPPRYLERYDKAQTSLEGF